MDDLPQPQPHPQPPRPVQITLAKALIVVVVCAAAFAAFRELGIVAFVLGLVIGTATLLLLIHARWKDRGAILRAAGWTLVGVVVMSPFLMVIDARSLRAAQEPIVGYLVGVAVIAWLGCDLHRRRRAESERLDAAAERIAFARRMGDDFEGDEEATRE